MKSPGELGVAKLMKHGGNIVETARRLGCRIDDLVDMSSNLTPFDVAPGLLDHLRAHIHECCYLPETASETLIDIFAARFNLAFDQILAGNGTTEFIHALPAAVDIVRAIVVTPTYSDYQLACERAGVAVSFFSLRPDEDFILDLDRLGRELVGDELVFICNPNNPTGVVTSSQSLRDFAALHPLSLFLVDESYLPFVREGSLLHLDLPENIYVIRSFSKIYGMAGLRLGFIASSKKMMSRLAKRTKPWGVNRLAQVAGEYVLSHSDDYVEKVVSFLEEERPFFAAALSPLPGVSVVHGAANFILSRLTGNLTTETLTENMLARRIMIRNCANFTGLDDSYFRISLKTRVLNIRCLQALREITEGKVS